MQGTKLECSQQCRGCARFSRKAVTRRLTAALLPSFCLLACFFWFCWYTVFSTGVFDHHHEAAHTHTPLKKKAGAHTHPQNLPKKRETTLLKTDVFLPLFSAQTRTDGRTDGRTHRKLKVTGLNYCIKKNIQVSNNILHITVTAASSNQQQQC